jgi:chromosome segregation ATPase
METDNKNLQVVIGQLRNAGRTKTGEAESIQLELQQLKSLNNNLLKDAEEYKRLLKRFEKFDIIVQERDQYQLKLQQLELQISDMKLHQALTEKDLYAKSTANDILQSELKMMKHDLDQRLEEVNNLQDAIQQMQSEHKYEINHFKSMIQEAHKQVNLEKLAEVLKEKEELVNQITDLDGQNKKLREQCEDQLLLRRQIELSFHQEKRKMQQSLEQVVAQMKNSTHDVIDRTLIANLIVSYFQRRR